MKKSTEGTLEKELSPALLYDQIGAGNSCETREEQRLRFRELAANFRVFRKRAGLTQDQVAIRAHTSQSEVSRFERGVLGNATIEFTARLLGTLEPPQTLTFVQEAKDTDNTAPAESGAHTAGKGGRKKGK